MLKFQFQGGEGDGGFWISLTKCTPFMMKLGMVVGYISVVVNQASNCRLGPSEGMLHALSSKIANFQGSEPFLA